MAAFLRFGLNELLHSIIMPLIPKEPVRFKGSLIRFYGKKDDSSFPFPYIKDATKSV